MARHTFSSIIRQMVSYRSRCGVGGIGADRADTVYRSAANEEFLAQHGRCSRVHHRKPKGKPMPAPLARGNAAKSKVPARVEHVFAEQK